MLDRRNFLQWFSGLLTVPLLPSSPTKPIQKVELKDVDFFFINIGAILICVDRKGQKLWDITIDVYGHWNPTQLLKDVIEGAGLPTQWKDPEALDFRSLVAQVHSDPSELLARIRQAIDRYPQADLYVNPDPERWERMRDQEFQGETEETGHA